MGNDKSEISRFVTRGNVARVAPDSMDDFWTRSRIAASVLHARKVGIRKASQRMV